MILGKNFQKTEDLGGKGVGRSEGMKDKCKVGSLNIFCIQTTYLPLLNIGSTLATEICVGSHHRLLRRQHCSSLCSQSEGHEHVANMANALAHDFVGFSAVFGRHNIRPNIRPPHFASKVSYSASPQTFAECSRSATCCYATTAMLLGEIHPKKEILRLFTIFLALGIPLLHV